MFKSSKVQLRLDVRISNGLARKEVCLGACRVSCYQGEMDVGGRGLEWEESIDGLGDSPLATNFWSLVGGDWGEEGAYV